MRNEAIQTSTDTTTGLRPSGQPGLPIGEAQVAAMVRAVFGEDAGAIPAELGPIATDLAMIAGPAVAASVKPLTRTEAAEKLAALYTNAMAQNADKPIAAVSARLIQLTLAEETKRGPSRAEDARATLSRAQDALQILETLPDPPNLQAVRETVKTLTEVRTIVAFQEGTLEAAINKAPKDGPPPISARVAQAFIRAFIDDGQGRANRESHNDWFTTGPGIGKNFLVRLTSDQVEAEAKRLADAKGLPVSDGLRMKAADALGRVKVTFSDGEGPATAEGRCLATTFDGLAKIVRPAREKAFANNADSIMAGFMGVIASLVDTPPIAADLSPAQYKAALADRFGDLLETSAAVRGASGWAELPIRERTAAIRYFRSIIGELAEVRLQKKGYEALSQNTLNVPRTTHDVYVHQRAGWLFDDAYGKAQAVPFEQLSKPLKDMDLPPLLFALIGMVEAAERR